LSDVDEKTSAHSAREATAQEEGGSKKKGKQGRAVREQAKAAPRACKGQKRHRDQSFRFYCRPSLLGVRCACAGPKGPAVGR